MDADDRVGILEDAIDHLVQAGELVRLLDDPFLNAYVAPQLEGQERGWLGEHAVDHLRAVLDAARRADSSQPEGQSAPPNGRPRR